MKGFGIFLLVVGILVLVVGLTMDTTVATGLGGDRVHNLGLMSQKQNTMIFGGVLSVVGAILAALRSGSAPQMQVDANSPSDVGGRKCPFCAESIKLEAVVCRFCNREIGPAPEVLRPRKVHSRLEELQMAKYGITCDGEKYLYDGHAYPCVEDAVYRAQVKSGAA